MDVYIFAVTTAIASRVRVGHGMPSRVAKEGSTSVTSLVLSFFLRCLAREYDGVCGYGRDYE